MEKDFVSDQRGFGLRAKKKGMNRNSTPFKNPISYEKPRRR
jgi:hypothetical protein